MKRNKHPYNPPTELEKEMGKVLGKTPYMIRFYGYRLAMEIALGRSLNHEDQNKIAGLIRSEMRLGKH